MEVHPSILLIYTGGTIGMIQDPVTHALKPFSLEHLIATVPELERFNFNIHSSSFETPIDSSDATPNLWVKLAQIIEEHHDQYDGFVILHGTDTMAYTASALSFALQNLSKPVILTGSQLPIGMLRTDGKENLISSIEIAAIYSNHVGQKRGEVCVYFDGQLFRGNRTIKSSTQHFEAFESPNYPSLAEVGVNVDFEPDHFIANHQGKFSVSTQFSNRVGVIHLFPGLSNETLQALFAVNENEGYILRTYGSGNAPTHPDFLKLLEEQVGKGKLILNITQCDRGTVNQGKYASSSMLENIGIIGGRDMTFEAGITKLMYLLGNQKDLNTIPDLLRRPLRGEMKS